MALGTFQFTIKKDSVVYIVRYRFPMPAAKDSMFGKYCEVNVSSSVLSSRTKPKACWLLHSLTTVFHLTLIFKSIFTGDAAHGRMTNGKNTIVSVQKVPLL